MVGITSRTAEHSAALADAHGIRAFESWEEMVDDPAVEVVDIAYPPDVQPGLIAEILDRDAGIRGILAQKPLATTLEDARGAVEACEERGVVLGVNQNMRYDHSIRALKSLLEEGRLGEPVMAQITMHTKVGWMPYADEYPRKGMLIMSIHHLDAFRFLFGDPESIVTTVRANPDSEDGVDEMAVYTLTYPQGLLAVAIDNTYATLDQGIEWRVDGTGGMASGSVGWMDHPWGSPSTLRYIDAERPDAAIEPRWTGAGSRTPSRRRWPRCCGRSPTAAPRASAAATTSGRWRCSRRPTARPRRAGRWSSPRWRSGLDPRRVRLRRRRGGLGRLRRRRPAQRGPGGRGRPRRGRAERLEPGDPRSGAVLGAAEVDPRLGLRERARTGVERPPHLPAARPRPRRHQLDEHDALRARRRRGLRLLGGRRDATAGRSRTCCRCSSAPRTTSGASPASTGPAARSRSRTPRSRRCCTHWVAAAEEAGHPANQDFNGETQDGVGVYQATQREGRRCSSSTAFVGPNLGRPNLTVLTCTQALRLQWIGDRASGVEIDRYGEAEFIRAGREVIISAGAYLSPQLLMLSGIGPADHLREMGIEPVLDNPAVGENLQDHPGCFLNYPARLGEGRRARAGSRPAASPAPTTGRCPTSSSTPPPAASPTRGSRPGGRRRSPSAPT